MTTVGRSAGDGEIGTAGVTVVLPAHNEMESLPILLAQLPMAFGATPYLSISAMPSVHVAKPVMYAPVLGSARRRMPLASAAYAIAILVASVHLGWQYAVDGDVSVTMLLAAAWLGNLCPESRS